MHVKAVLVTTSALADMFVYPCPRVTCNLFLSLSLSLLILQGPVEDWMLMQTHDSSDTIAAVLDGKLNPYAAI